MKILIVGTINDFCLETSYSTAAFNLGSEVIKFDPSKAAQKFVRFGKIGKYVNELLPIEVWLSRHFEKSQKDRLRSGGTALTTVSNIPSSVLQ